jgi:hypothetical protein
MCYSSNFSYGWVSGWVGGWFHGMGFGTRFGGVNILDSPVGGPPPPPPPANSGDLAAGTWDFYVYSYVGFSTQSKCRILVLRAHNLVLRVKKNRVKNCS